MASKKSEELSQFMRRFFSVLQHANVSPANFRSLCRADCRGTAGRLDGRDEMAFGADDLQTRNDSAPGQDRDLPSGKASSVHPLCRQILLRFGRLVTNLHFVALKVQKVHVISAGQIRQPTSQQDISQIRQNIYFLMANPVSLLLLQIPDAEQDLLIFEGTFDLCTIDFGPFDSFQHSQELAVMNKI